MLGLVGVESRGLGFGPWRLDVDCESVPFFFMDVQIGWFRK